MPLPLPPPVRKDNVVNLLEYKASRQAPAQPERPTTRRSRKSARLAPIDHRLRMLRHLSTQAR